MAGVTVVVVVGGGAVPLMSVGGVVVVVVVEVVVVAGAVPSSTAGCAPSTSDWSPGTAAAASLLASAGVSPGVVVPSVVVGVVVIVSVVPSSPPHAAISKAAARTAAAARGTREGGTRGCRPAADRFVGRLAGTGVARATRPSRWAARSHAAREPGRPPYPVRLLGDAIGGLRQRSDERLELRPDALRVIHPRRQRVSAVEVIHRAW